MAKGKKPYQPNGILKNPDIPLLPQKYPKEVKSGGKMDYSEVAFPKPPKKPKKKGWGR
jgi:hypothetical protein